MQVEQPSAVMVGERCQGLRDVLGRGQLPLVFDVPAFGNASQDREVLGINLVQFNIKRIIIFPHIVSLFGHVNAAPQGFRVSSGVR